MNTLRDIGEVAAIARLIRRLPRRRDIARGAGDDCAVVRAGAWDWLLTSDPVIEGVHFAADAPPAAVGRKAVGRVLSDLAAMGGEPCWALLDVVAPPDTPAATLDKLYRGLLPFAARRGLAVVGGDLARGPRLEIHAFAVGRVPRGQAVLRRGARPGDGLYVTGALGGSLAGRHLHFEPRLREGVWLRRWASAMIDVSDGLATDARHLAAESGVGFRLELPRLPVSRAAAAARDGRSALEHALSDGEDFELLFTVPTARERAFAAAWRRRFRLRCTRIGEALARREPPLLAVDRQGAARPLTAAGYEHFRGAEAGA